MPSDLKERLELEARENSRSLTAEIVSRLERSFTASEIHAPPGPRYEVNPVELEEIEMRAAEWGCSKTQALIRMTIEELEAKR